MGIFEGGCRVQQPRLHPTGLCGKLQTDTLLAKAGSWSSKFIRGTMKGRPSNCEIEALTFLEHEVLCFAFGVSGNLSATLHFHIWWFAALLSGLPGCGFV